MAVERRRYSSAGNSSTDNSGSSSGSINRSISIDSNNSDISGNFTVISVSNRK